MLQFSFIYTPLVFEQLSLLFIICFANTFLGTEQDYFCCDASPLLLLTTAAGWTWTFDPPSSKQLETGAHYLIHPCLHWSAARSAAIEELISLYPARERE